MTTELRFHQWPSQTGIADIRKPEAAAECDAPDPSRKSGRLANGLAGCKLLHYLLTNTGEFDILPCGGGTWRIGCDTID